MKIGIIATHSWPIPYKNHGGDICILDLAKALKQLGHEVTMFAPAGTDFVNLYPMRCSYGKYPPAGEDCEQECFNRYSKVLFEQDIIHDFSVSKRITQSMNDRGFMNTCCTLLGGPWLQSRDPVNLIVWSNAHKDRVLRGATDYENTPTPDLAGPNGNPIWNAHVVYGGIDTGYYCPDKYEKSDYYLWLNRWHPAKGCEIAIELAKKMGFKLIVAGEDPANEVSESQAKYALEMTERAKGWDNIEVRFLPLDPHHHEAKRDLYRRAKALLYTVQFQEPFGLSQVEALACGTPVIGTKFGSVPEVINDGETGFVCENNIYDLSKAITKVEKLDPVECRKNAVKRFDKHIFARNCVAEYEKILKGECW